jgi:hypothetical protein
MGRAQKQGRTITSARTLDADGKIVAEVSCSSESSWVRESRSDNQEPGRRPNDSKGRNDEAVEIDAELHGAHCGCRATAPTDIDTQRSRRA